ncbi:MAG: YfhO family protein [Lachnospiraceae bacterium]|nr:YfhO family protein [Lachnospiraceae bacterium]
MKQPAASPHTKQKQNASGKKDFSVQPGIRFYYVFSFLFPVCMLMIIFYMKGILPFGNNSLFIGTTAEKAFSVLHDYVRLVQSGQFSLLHPAGLAGMDFGDAFWLYLSSPFTLVLGFFTPDTAFRGLSVLTVLRLGFAGLCMAHYLYRRAGQEHFAKQGYLLMLFSVSYPLSGALLTAQTDYRFLDCFMLLPLLMLLYEGLICKQQKKGLIILLTVLLIDNCYIGTVCAVILVLDYCIIKRALLAQSEKKNTSLSLLSSVAISLLLSSVSVIPGVLSFYKNILSHTAWPGTDPAHAWSSIPGRFLPFCDQSFLSAGSSGLNLYCGILPLIFFLLYFVCKKKNTGTENNGFARFRTACFLLLLITVSNIPALGRAFALRSDYTDTFAPLSFIIIFYIISKGAEATNSLKSIRLAAFIPVALLPCMYFIYSLAVTGDFKRSSLTSLTVCLILHTLFVLALRIKPVRPDLLELFILLLFLGELFLNTEHILFQCQNYTDYYSEQLETLKSPDQDLLDPLSDFGLSLPVPSEDLQLRVPAFCLLPGEYKNPQEGSFEYETINRIARSLSSASDLLTREKADISIPSTDKVRVKESGDDFFTVFCPNSEKDVFYIGASVVPEETGHFILYTDHPEYIGETAGGQELVRGIRLNRYGNNRIVFPSICCRLHTDALEELISSLSNMAITSPQAALFGYQIAIPDNRSQETTSLIVPVSEKQCSIRIGNDRATTVPGPDHSAVVSVPSGAQTVTVRKNMRIPSFAILLSLAVMACCLISRQKKIRLTMIKNAAQTLIDHLTAHRGLILSFVLPLSMLSVACICCGDMPFGDRFFFKGDGCGETIPALFQYKAGLENRSLLYSLLIGGGSNLFYSRPNALAFLWTLLPSNAHLISFASIILMIKISLCGTAMHVYLTHRSFGKRLEKNDIFTLVLSCSWALCSYSINYRHYLLWTDILFLFPLLLIAQEHMLASEESIPKKSVPQKSAPYVLLLFLCIWASPMLSIYICLFLLLRFFTFQHGSAKRLLRNLTWFGLASVLSAGMAFRVLYVNLLSRSVGAYQYRDNVKPSLFVFYQSYLKSLRQLFLLPDAVSITTENGAINLYFGVFLFTLALTAVITQKKNAYRIFRLSCIAFLFFASNNDLLSYLLNGMHYQVKVPNRYSFIMIFLLLDLAANAPECITYLSKKKLVLTISVLAGIFLLSSFSGTPPIPIEAFFLSLACIVISVLLIRAGRHAADSGRSGIRGLFCFFCCLELLFQCTYFLMEESPGDGLSIPDTMSATEFLQQQAGIDNSFTRVNFYTIPCYNLNMVNRVSSINEFDSFITENQYNYAASLGLYATPNLIYSPTVGNPFINAVTDTRYFLVNSQTEAGDHDFSNLQLIGQRNSYYFLENDRCLSAGFFIPSDTLQRQDDITSAYTLSNVICSAFNGSRPIYTDTIELSDKSTPSSETAAPSDNYYISTRETDGEWYETKLHFTPTKSGHWYLKTLCFYDIGTLEKDAPCEITIRTRTKDNMTVTCFDEDAFSAFYENASQHVLSITDCNDSSLSGSITCPDDGGILLSIPYDDGWQVSLDGISVRAQQFVNGAMMIPVTKGTHTLSMTFRPIGLTESMIVTGLFWMAFLIWMTAGFFLRKKRQAP